VKLNSCELKVFHVDLKVFYIRAYVESIVAQGYGGREKCVSLVQKRCRAIVRFRTEDRYAEAGAPENVAIVRRRFVSARNEGQ